MFSTAYWKESENDAQFVLSSTLPSDLPMSAAKLVSIVDDRLLLVNTPKGWDIPGGHVEAGETTIDALRREITEETGGVLADDLLVGYVQDELNSTRE